MVLPFDFRDFDSDKLQQDMIKAGVYQSIKPDGTITAEPWQ